MEKKLTKKDFYGKLLDLIKLHAEDATEQEQLTEFVQHEIELIEKKAEKAKGYQRKKEKDVLKDMVFEALTEDFQTIKEIVAAIDSKEIEVTSAKVTARLTALAKENSVIKEEITIEVPGAKEGTTKKAKCMGYRLSPIVEEEEVITE